MDAAFGNTGEHDVPLPSTTNIGNIPVVQSPKYLPAVRMIPFRVFSINTLQFALWSVSQWASWLFAHPFNFIFACGLGPVNLFNDAGSTFCPVASQVWCLFFSFTFPSKILCFFSFLSLHSFCGTQGNQHNPLPFVGKSLPNDLLAALVPGQSCVFSVCCSSRKQARTMHWSIVLLTMR